MQYGRLPHQGLQKAQSRFPSQRRGWVVTLSSMVSRSIPVYQAVQRVVQESCFRCPISDDIFNDDFFHEGLFVTAQFPNWRPESRRHGLKIAMKGKSDGKKLSLTRKTSRTICRSGNLGLSFKLKIIHSRRAISLNGQFCGLIEHDKLKAVKTLKATTKEGGHDH